jgi:hypothetical protein
MDSAPVHSKVAPIRHQLPASSPAVTILHLLAAHRSAQRSREGSPVTRGGERGSPNRLPERSRSQGPIVPGGIGCELRLSPPIDGPGNGCLAHRRAQPQRREEPDPCRPWVKCWQRDSRSERHTKTTRLPSAGATKPNCCDELVHVIAPLTVTHPRLVGAGS